MEKGKYLVSLKDSTETSEGKTKSVFELTIISITEKCYRISENKSYTNSYYSSWILKEDFDNKYEIIEQIEKPVRPTREPENSSKPRRKFFSNWFE